MGNTPEQSKRLEKEEQYYSLTKKVFRELAPFYDIIAAPLTRVRDKVVTFAGAPQGVRILDVATGTGKQAFAFARKGYDVTGIDLTKAMLEVARKKNKYQNARFEVADATNLPFADGAFDVTSISLALHDMPLTIREKVLKEMLRVTRPDGMMVIVDYGLPGNKIGRFLIYRLVRLYEGQYYASFINSDLKTLLTEAGIEVKEEVPALLGAVRILKGVKVRAE